MQTLCRRAAWGRLVLAGLGLAWWAPMAQALQLPAGVEMRRTTDGIAHLRAANWRNLGFGVGYVQAQDALCTLAEAFVTYRGQRSLHFGAEARPVHNASFGRPKNLDLDFFFRAFADDAVLSRARTEQPKDLIEANEGYAAGYNRYLADARRAPAPQQACLSAAWVGNITGDDLLRRMVAAQLAAGYSRFVTEIVNARPAAAGHADAALATGLRCKLAQQVGEQAGLGSNALAFGRQATGEEGAVLFGNPHWYWGGPERFYQMHLTIPGRLDVAGVAFLGVPLIMIGFNDHVAWSHTVSSARRFGLFDLTLDPADPTRHQVDGTSEALQTREVAVDVREADGRMQRVTRTLYRSRFGPMVDLGRHAAAFGWGSGHALAMRDVNAENFRVFRNFFYWNQATSLDEFMAIQRREAAVPWVNTVAIGRGDGRVWLGDVGAAPNVPDALRKACTTPLGQGFAGLDPFTPFLDGSRSACNWQVDSAAVQPGAMPAAAMPGLLRDDYVANMNDSYWLSNVNQPLEGFPSVLGGERQALSLRGRLGHRIAQEILSAAQPAGSAQALGERVMQATLVPRSLSAELFKADLLAPVCAMPQVGEVNVAHACEVLQHWSGLAGANDRGALLWNAFWTRLAGIPASEFYRVAFAPEAPLDTPHAPNADDPRVAQALAVTVASFAEQGVALDAPLGSRRFVHSGGRRLALFGGCHAVGYFTVDCDGKGGFSQPVGPDAVGNSYLQVVHFGPRGVQAHTLLAHGLDETAVSDGTGTAPVARYARKDWLQFPFREDEIARDPGLTRRVLKP